MMHAAYRIALAVLALACVSHGCGPVGATAPERHVEATARRSLAAALRQALVEACRATTPPPDSHPALAIAWAAVCSPDIMPAVGVSPAPPPASPLEVP